ncbi:flagellar basal body-associated FliL family protein [Tissierella pigra]|uniref:Flagellar protein FliL n=1 Tax=Tissierella pigra TaxID=2607614 RepID=A0A6N7XE37_9FIRM|nr:flagellar basal body-associated FliL family protein [Tissierella pigra]MBU5426539.1 flagellar basal body-associated FliL family protein [Tissierella pigra]MSU00016.1 flagellar basal body-associated FliL family protein [Tissierella pigra]
MSKNNTLMIIIILLLSLIAGIGVGIFFFSNKTIEKSPKDMKTYSLTLEDMYCNIKESKKILKIKFTIEITNEKTLETLTAKQFLIRDEANKIIRNLTEEDLKGKEGQTSLQNQLKESIIELFNDESITNIYFDDFIMQ